MSLVFYWTDIFVFIFLALSIFLIVAKRRSPLFKAIRYTIFTQSRYVVAFLIVMLFVLFGVLDSIHLKRDPSSHTVESVLDILLTPRNHQREKTYSAPFAQFSFIPEIVKTDSGQIQESFPPLKYVNPNATIWGPVAVGLGLSGLLVFALYRWRHNTLKNKMPKPVERTFWLTVFFIFSMIAISALLFQDYHILGTDKIGRDVFYITIKSIRTGLVIGTVTLLVLIPLALSFGIWSGYFQGWIDDVIQYFYTTLGSIPGILLIAAAVISFQIKIEENPDLKLLMLCIILGATGWIGLCRLLRGETLKLREAEFVQAAKVLGVRDYKILLKHILPNVMHIVIISVVLEFSGLVLAEAVLSYVGVGVSPTTLSWGTMINGARLEMAREPMVWWSLAGAFVFMFTLVFATNILGDALQEALDPKRQ